MVPEGILPGGLLGSDGALRRDYAFRALDGRVEAALWAARDVRATKAARVSILLGAALAKPEGGVEAARALSVGDRQWLLARLGLHIGLRQVWVCGICAECGASFDAALDLSALPAKPAGAGYPRAQLNSPKVSLSLRAPTGADQEAIADLPETEAFHALLTRCVDGADADDLRPETLCQIDAILADLSPETASEITARCPNCGAECRAAFDLADILVANLRDPLRDVHDIASVYHWSEGDILDLPTERRHRYLRLIDQARGMTD